jgi:AcrR family transcriptional regulator
MTTPGRRVKTKRAYDATRRREQARRSQDRIIEAAQRFFLTQGYAATSIAAIATDAEVSVDTIYKTFGGKPGLIRAIYQRALQGQGPTPAEQRSDLLQATEPDPHKVISGWGRFVTEIAPRATPIFVLIRSAAATDTALEALIDEIHNDRLRRMTDNARRLHQAGHLRDSVTVAAAADILWTYSSPELYELLVIRRGMPLQRYGEFVAEAMSASLLPPPPG